MPIRLENISYTYNKGQPDETAALSGVSLEIADSSFTALIGHTGSGKSTLVQLLNGLLKPSRGSIYVDGTDISAGAAEMAKLRMKVGLVFQYPEYQLFEETVEKDIAFGPVNLGLSAEEVSRRVREAAEMTGLDFDRIAGRSPFELSGGQKRKVAIAGVIAMRPHYLVLDEPAAGLDPQAHDDIMDLLVRLRRDWNCTIVIVSHSMDDVAVFCDHVLVMNHGRLALSGSPREVFGNAGILKKIGLGLPSAGELQERLREKGIDAGTGALDEEEAAQAVAALFGSRSGSRK